jgi:hypothetical protein
MKRQISLFILLGLAAATAWGQTAKLTAPQAGASWPVGSSQAVTWTWNGAAKVKLLLFRANGSKLGIIQSGLQLGAGSYSWKVGTLEDGTVVPAAGDYAIRIVVQADNKVLDAGPAFAITAPGQPAAPMTLLTVTQLAVVPPLPPSASTSITVSKPGKGDVWIPLKTYALEWSWTVPLDQPGCPSGCPVDVWLVPAAAPAQKIPLLNKFACYNSSSKGIVTYFGQYQGIVPILASGDYSVRVARCDKPGFCGDSPPFAVKSTLSTDTAYLGPDHEAGQSDLAITDIFFDSEGNISMKIRNQGDSYKASPSISFEIFTTGNFSNLMKKGEIHPDLAFAANEERQVPLTEWGGFNFRQSWWDAGKFIPVNSRPFAVTVRLSDAHDINSSNNVLRKEMCMIHDADIGTDGNIKLTFSPQQELFIMRGTSNQIHEAKIKWLSQDTFAADLEVVIWNYGAVAKTFDCLLFVDNLPGQLVFGGATLQAGHKTTLNWPVKIKVPGKCGAHRLLFIADPKEHDNEPYPNSYQNNCIDVTLKIQCGGTVTGSN